MQSSQRALFACRSVLSPVCTVLTLVNACSWA
jgi:hypothetical protein